MSIVQARNKLKRQKKGGRKDPPQIPSLGDHTPPASIFLGERKVSMSIAQVRNKLKGQKKGSRKNLPQIPSLGDHTPPASFFLSNPGNHANHNNLWSVAMNPQRENAVRMLGSLITAASTPMLERVQKRVLDKFMDAKSTLQTKRVAAKVHKQLAHNDATFTSVVD